MVAWDEELNGNSMVAWDKELYGKSIVSASELADSSSFLWG